ncbi:MAG: NfeD family protein [Gammaproteobacteria bacterium]|jgi:membrane protein implicated in regulation of membrane protease activity|nr:NfeD family protein [Gammaproteobacteria bacterium]MBU1491942.1 NfeD family protein [Gammaproteobacteria bacterium]MBU2065755.1 NfeD family protein [Gammaproteobacteria bacterium]MBU2140544.1 NfeD family protein [Gammaproteobacteria bacterium]MBU2216475.1 NfeD family protein [Gammaproteobacteria bacterium]
MFDALQHLSFWNWLAFGTLLLILEVFGAGGYLLWIGLAAAAVGLLTYLIPDLHWTLQFVLFGVLAILTAVYWWRRQRTAAKPSDQPGLNQRGSELLGRTFTLHDAISGGRGKIKAGDSLWLVSGPELPAGSQVRVIGQDGVLLKVDAVP